MMKMLYAMSFLVLAAMALMQMAVVAAEQTYAERLGWGPKDRVVLFH